MHRGAFCHGGPGVRQSDRAMNDERPLDERPLFRHPPWMVGIMLILGAMSLFVGLTVDPFWLVMGAPAILTLVVYVGVRIALSFGFGVPPPDPAGGSRQLHEPDGGAPPDAPVP